MHGVVRAKNELPEGDKMHRRPFAAVSRFASSVTAKLVVLVAIFVALPILVYAQFEHANAQLRDFVTQTIEHRNWLIAEALRPVLNAPDRNPALHLDGELAKYADDDTRLELMLRPAAKRAGGRFFYVAASPSSGDSAVNAELHGMTHHGIIDSLSQSCDAGRMNELQYQQEDGQDRILTSVVPIETRWGCWALVSSHATSEFLYTSIARPFWASPEVRIGGLIYLLAALVAILLVSSVGRSLRHFRQVAVAIRQGRARDGSFAARHVVPELASAAADFDALARDLRHVARDIREAAEDNAHSFKAPVAAIEASLETARGGLRPNDAAAQRAIELMRASIGRLKALIAAAQRLDNVTADLIEAPRGRVELGAVIGNVLFRARDLLAGRQIRLYQYLDARAFVNGSAQIFEEAIENILDNAISFSPRNGAITVTLVRSPHRVDLRIDDQGPGIAPDKLNRIFDRYFSLRPHSAGDDLPGGKLPHAGLGLWIVRRNIEALGGTVTATQLHSAGLSVRIALPASRG